MKSNTALRVVDSNSHSSKDFSIQASGKMFHMVISGLYSNKPQSITREIWSNAYDAHAMVGKEHVPFDVTFPTSLTPTFSCRDYGPGIAHADMEGFYTVLGHSTKEGTNKAVGKWGVGRMSPMSYTDTFSVTSYHKGMVAYYSIQLGPDGSPQLHVLAPPMPTDQPDGLEVSFPVRRDDIHQFQLAADLVSSGFDVKPRIKNSQDKQFTPINKLFEGEGFYIYEGGRMSGAYAQMGCVLYPIPSQHLERAVNIVYQFDIGDLEVTASREALSFGPNDPTADSIKRKSEAVDLALWQVIQDRIEAQPKPFLAARMAWSLQSYVRRGSPAFTYKGKPLLRTWKLQPTTGMSVCAGSKGYRNKTVGWSTETDISVHAAYTIFVQDTSNKKDNARAGRRIAAALHQYGNFIWVRANLSDPAERADVDRLTDELEFPVSYVQDLPDEGAVKGVSRAVKVSRIDDKGNPYKADLTDADMKAGGLYYPMTRDEYPWILRMVQLLVTHMGANSFVLVPKTLWKKFETSPQWKPVMPALEVFVKGEEKKLHSLFNNRYDLHLGYNHGSMTYLKKFLHVGGDVAAFAEKVAKGNPSEHLGVMRQHWQDLLKHFGLPELHDKDSTKEYYSVLDKYPLLRLYGGDRMTQEFTDYIKMIDATNAEKE